MNRRTPTHAEATAIYERILRLPPPPAPLWYTDQLEAAVAEAGQLVLAAGARMRALRPDQALRSTVLKADPAMSAPWVAAIMRCRWCPHMRGGVVLQPCLADLNHKRVNCLRCARTFRTPIADDRCEVCDSTGHTRFRSACIQIGAVMTTAEVGPCCWHLLPEVGDGE